MGRTTMFRRTTIFRQTMIFPRTTFLPGAAIRSRPRFGTGRVKPGSRDGTPVPTPRSRGTDRQSTLIGRRRTIEILLLATLVLAAGCGFGPGDSGEWTPEEREAVDSLISGLGHLRAGITALNEGGGTPQPTGAIRDRALEHLRRAERATAGISDSVLAKIHPELPARYRARLRRGIEDRIRSLEGGHLYRYSSAVTRLGEWAEWYNRTRDDWNLPRR